MVFKISKTLLFASVVLHLFSCVGPKLSEGDENIIGNKLENVSSLKTSSGGDSAAVVLFEPLVQKIYQFNFIGGNRFGCQFRVVCRCQNQAKGDGRRTGNGTDDDD